ncbi:MAG: sugar ABC transporter permease [Actinomycetota bacterium]
MDVKNEVSDLRLVPGRSAARDRLRAGIVNGALAGGFFGLFFAQGSALVGLIAGLLVGGGFGAAAARLLPGIEARYTRMAVSAGLGGAAGVIAGLVLSEGLLPALRSNPMIAWTAALAALGLAYAYLRQQDYVVPVIVGAAVGWMIGTLGWPSLGNGTRAEAIMVLAVLGALAAAFAVRNPPGDGYGLSLRPALFFGVGVAAFGALRFMNQYGTDENLEQLVTAVVNVLIAVFAVAALWVGLNLLFGQTSTNFVRFSAVAGALVGVVMVLILDGNRALQTVGPRETVADAFDDMVNAQHWLTLAVLVGGLLAFVGRAIDRYEGTTRYMPALAAIGVLVGAGYGWTYVEDFPGDTIINLLWWPVIAGAVTGLAGWALAKTDDPMRRLGVGLAAGAGLGLLFGFTLKTRYLPALKLVPLLAWPIGLAAVGAAISTARSRMTGGVGNPVRAALWLALVGWGIGAWAVPTLGGGTRAEGLMAFVIPGLILGALVGLSRQADTVRKAEIDQRSRGFIFLGPAMLFIFAALIVPTIITFILSFRSDDRSAEVVGFENYQNVLSAESNLDFSGWRGIFTSNLTWIGLVLGAIAVTVALIMGRQQGRRTAFTPHSAGMGVLAIVLFSFAIFTNLRGTIINNLWWIFGVTTFATCFGLAVAAWADGIKGERVAKSLIFMPMAISLVGASIIWRFMYTPRDPSKEQTGVMNAFWVWLGDKTSGASDLGIGVFDWHFFSLPGRAVAVVIFLAISAGFAYAAWRSFHRDGLAGLIGFGLAALVPLYFVAQILFDGGIGGLQDPNPPGPTILFRESGPFNNWWLMMVMLWIETGFAMVILSAAIKAVPAEFIEAAKIDGADDTQVFWRIIVPQIAPTIGVVVTTIIVKVTKVFDIVKVMTNGNFDTNVLANEMINQSFQFANPGTGSTLAVLLFLSVLPVMVVNVLRMQREAA